MIREETLEGHVGRNKRARPDDRIETPAALLQQHGGRAGTTSKEHPL